MKTRLTVFWTLTVFTVMLVSACDRSDVDLQNAVQEKLKSSGIVGVTVIVKEGVVTLGGEVNDDAARTKAEGFARSVDGVVSVVNQTTVRAPVLSESDRELKNKIEENWRKAGCDGATVDVKDGVATVGGVVPDAKYAQCLLILSQSGATQQVNNLRTAK